MNEVKLNIKWLFLILVIYFIIYICNFSAVFKINTFVWFAIFLVAYRFFDRNNRVKAKIEKIQIIFIVILAYLIVYYLSGLIMGFSRSPYAHDILSIIKNFWDYLIVIFFQEYVRSVLIVNEKKNYSILIGSILMFSIFELNILSLLNNFTDAATIFKYFFSTMLVVFIRNILLTYLNINSGLRVALIYRVPIMFVNLVMPIFPSYDWFFTSLSGILLPFVVYIVFNYFSELKTSRETRRHIKKQSPLKKIPLLVIILVIVCFVGGFFKYMPVAIMSNSMSDLIKRGDAVIVSKLNEKEKKYLEVNDIIEYKLNNAVVVHRIIDIEKASNGELIFTTKGDNNLRKDDKKVKESQVIGKVYLKIPKLGYPSVLLSELFSKEKPNVELGK